MIVLAAMLRIDYRCRVETESRYKVFQQPRKVMMVCYSGGSSGGTDIYFEDKANRIS